MRLRRLATVVLFVFVAGFVSAAAGEALHSSVDSSLASSAESSSCPDPGEDGSPCGPTCPCACCPGHLTMAAFGAAESVHHFPSTAELHVFVPRNLHPKDVYFRIFHPPRA